MTKKVQRKLLEVMDMHFFSTMWWLHRYIPLTKFIKLDDQSRYILLCINHTSIKLCFNLKVKVTQPCPPLWNPMDCGLCPQDSLGQNTGGGCHSLLQGIFPTLGSNLQLLHCRRILYHLSQQGKCEKYQYLILNFERYII